MGQTKPAGPLLGVGRFTTPAPAPCRIWVLGRTCHGPAGFRDARYAASPPHTKSPRRPRLSRRGCAGGGGVAVHRSRRRRRQLREALLPGGGAGGAFEGGGIASVVVAAAGVILGGGCEVEGCVAVLVSARVHLCVCVRAR
jgi:hypothetical protein